MRTRWGVRSPRMARWQIKSNVTPSHFYLVTFDTSQRKHTRVSNGGQVREQSGRGCAPRETTLPTTSGIIRVDDARRSGKVDPRDFHACGAVLVAPCGPVCSCGISPCGGGGCRGLSRASATGNVAKNGTNGCFQVSSVEEIGKESGPKMGEMVLISLGFC